MDTREEYRLRLIAHMARHIVLALGDNPKFAGWQTYALARIRADQEDIRTTVAAEDLDRLQVILNEVASEVQAYLCMTPDPDSFEVPKPN